MGLSRTNNHIIESGSNYLYSGSAKDELKFYKALDGQVEKLEANGFKVEVKFDKNNTTISHEGKKTTRNNAFKITISRAGSDPISSTIYIANSVSSRSKSFNEKMLVRDARCILLEIQTIANNIVATKSGRFLELVNSPHINDKKVEAFFKNQLTMNVTKKMAHQITHHPREGHSALTDKIASLFSDIASTIFSDVDEKSTSSSGFLKPLQLIKEKIVGYKKEMLAQDLDDEYQFSNSEEQQVNNPVFVKATGGDCPLFDAAEVAQDLENKIKQSRFNKPI